MVRSLRNKTKVRGMAFCCLIVIIVGCSGCVEDDSESKLPFDQSMVGSRINFVEGLGGSSAAWGDHIVKIVATENTVFTYVMERDASSRQAFLYSKTTGEGWQEGKAFDTLNPPNLLVDSQGLVHLVSFESYTLDDREGRLFHVKFDEPETVSGSYTFEYLTPERDYTKPLTLDTYTSCYYGAAIGEDDTILVVYQNSLQWGDPPHSLGARIYDPIADEWSYESVATDLTSRLCYPFVAATNEYFHVLAVEDDPDEDLEAAGVWPFRYGLVKHFQRARDSDEWVESTLIDFNPTLSKLEISELWLRNYELLVDSEGTVHVLILYCGDIDSGTPCTCEECEPIAYHYWKEESSTEWHSELAIDTSCGWLRLWEREDGKLFYVYSKWNKQLCLIPQGTTERHIISDLKFPYIDDPNPFIAAARGGTRPSSTLNLVLFSNTKEIEAVAISVDVSQL